MKRILLAGCAIATLSAAAWAMDGDKQHTSIEVDDGHSVIVGGDGPVIELRGENGERTIHMERDGAETVITVDGRTVEIRGGEVVVDGQRVEAGRSSMVVVDGDDIRVIDNDFTMEFDTEFSAHMAERAEHLARMHEDLAGNFAFEFDAEDLEAEVMASLESTLADLENRELRYSGSDWDDLSEAEREEVREALSEARDEVREAMQEVRAEMAEMARDRDGERRRVRVELRNAQREMARAEREMARAEREIERERRHVEIRRHSGARAEARDAHREAMRWQSGDNGEFREHRDIRIEESDDGRRRVWIDGEEQTGDSLVDWLNRLETDRLAGAGGNRHRRVERLVIEGEEDVDIDRDDGHRVVILERKDAVDHD